MMPSQSKKQHNFMALVANNPAAARRLKVPQSVGEDFMKADMGKKFKEGGTAMKKMSVKMMEGGKSDTAQDKAMIKKAFKQHDKQEHQGGVGTKLKLKKGGMMPKGMMAFEKSGKDVEMKGVKEGSKKDMMMDKKQMMGMKKGGMTMAAFEKSGKDVEMKGMKEGSKADMAMDKKQMMGMKKGYAEGGMTMVNKGGKMVPDFAADGVGKMKKGGMATMKYARGGGIESKGKTKGTMIKMKSGGRAC